jgi:hypothetical protein
MRFGSVGINTRRRTAAGRPGRLGFRRIERRSLLTEIADLIRKTLFSGISGFKEALSRRKCMVRLHPGRRTLVRANEFEAFDE